MRRLTCRYDERLEPTEDTTSLDSHGREFANKIATILHDVAVTMLVFGFTPRSAEVSE